MPAARRPHLDDRRRLVIYSQRYSADAPAQSQRTAAVEASLRGARKPAAAYGWRVQRRLRARLFGIVPVRRRALLAVVAAIFAAVAVLALGHWAALWWPPVALRPALARPLRLDRPDSFGSWLGAAMMAAAAGGSFMIYQLRRYRADDYRGHYRMWRLAIVLCLLASLDSVVHLASWLGAAIDVVLAERDVVAGADWVRLMLTVGGAAFGLRMSVELARCRTAAATMIFALALFGISSATRWNLLRFEEATAVTWLPIALVAGQGVFLVSVAIYLRMLYREVRKLAPSEPLSRRLRKLVPTARPSLRWRRRGERGDAAEEPPPASKKTTRRSSERASKRVVAESSEEPSEAVQEKSKWRMPFGRRGKAVDEDATAEEPSAEEAGESEGEEVAPRRKRFGLPFGRRGKAAGEDASAEESSAEEAGESDEGEVAPRRKRFGLPFGRRGKAAGEDASAEEPSAEEAGESDDGEVAPRRKRFGLPFGRRGKAAGEDASAEEPSAEEAGESEEGEVAPRRKRFGLPFGRRGKAAGEDASAEEPSAEEAGEADDGEAAPRRKWFKLPSLRRAAAAEESGDALEEAEGPRSAPRGSPQSAAPQKASPPKPAPQKAAPQKPAPQKPAPGADPEEDDDSDDADFDPEGVDWESMNKSERRRARKLLKRQGKAA